MRHKFNIFFCLISLSLLLNCCSLLSSEERLHPEFTITKNDLLSLENQLETSVFQKIIQKPQIFIELMQQTLEQPASLYILVDKNHPLQSSYIPENLISLDRYNINTSRSGHKVSELIIPDLVAMTATAAKENIQLVVSSGYRSFDYQASLFARYVKQIGIEKASRLSAQAGQSQHQLGTTIDFGSISTSYEKTPNGIWMSKNAWEFGFSLSYPPDGYTYTGYDYEPWHFRYIGRTGTLIEKDYFNGTQQKFLEFYSIYRSWFAERKIELSE